MNVLYPVIMAVPEALARLPRPEAQRALSRLARQPLALSALKKGVRLPAVLEKSRQGAPLPADDLWWSVTHKPEFVAGVVSFRQTGIDVEKIVPVSSGLFKKIVSPEEQSFFDCNPQTVFFRCWTAKEAVLKAEGKGLAGLNRCRIDDVLDDSCLTVTFDNTRWLVEQWPFNGHLAAVVKEKTDRVQWTMLDADENEIRTLCASE